MNPLTQFFLILGALVTMIVVIVWFVDPGDGEE